MMRFSLYFFIAILLFSGYTRAEKDAAPGPKTFSQVRLVTESKYPSVRIKEYTLITTNAEAQRADAEAIMQVKMEVPRAMQTKDPAQFNRVLARDFIFRS